MSTCTRCGAGFSCGMIDGPANQACWCTDLPILAKIQTNVEGVASGCFCPRCLRAIIEQEQEAARRTTTP